MGEDGHPQEIREDWINIQDPCDYPPNGCGASAGEPCKIGCPMKEDV